VGTEKIILLKAKLEAYGLLLAKDTFEAMLGVCDVMSLEAFIFCHNC
jgi:hypothetical protein